MKCRRTTGKRCAVTQTCVYSGGRGRESGKGGVGRERGRGKGRERGEEGKEDRERW